MFDIRNLATTAALVACYSCTIFLSSFAHAYVVIDDFEVGDTTLVTIGPSGNLDTESATGVIGNERQVELVSTGGISSSSINLQNNGLYTQGSSNGSTSGLLLYDGIGSTGLGSVDLTDGGSLNKLVFQGLGIDSGFAQLSVTINDTKVDLPSLSGATSGNFAISLSLFGGAQLAAERIQIDLDLGFDTDLQLGAIVTSTPEPVTLVIWSILGCCGMGIAKYRSRLSA